MTKRGRPTLFGYKLSKREIWLRAEEKSPGANARRCKRYYERRKALGLKGTPRRNPAAKLNYTQREAAARLRAIQQEATQDVT